MAVELRPFATARQAADIGGITPSDIGVVDTAFVRKSDLVKTGKFDDEKIVESNSYDFVHLDNVFAKTESGMVVTPAELNFSSDGESKDFVIRTGDSWEIE